MERRKGFEGPNRSIEKMPERPLFEITLMRHAKPFYKNEGHDLTEEGVAQAQEVGKSMLENDYFAGSDVYLVHSPTARAKGTLDFVVEAAGLQEQVKRSTNQLRQSDIHDREAFLASIAAFAEEEGIDHTEAAARHHYAHSMHEEGEIIEKHSKKRERLYRSLEHLARWFDRHPPEGTKTPHILAVSHFELITHLIHDVFGIETMGKFNTPAFAEYVRIKVYPRSDGNLVMNVSYNDNQKDVLFDRSTRTIQAL